MISNGNKFLNTDNYSNSKTVFTGDKYRITILSERLIRLEYSENNTFNNNKTLLARNRNFDVPGFKVVDDSKFLIITTKYFTLQYTKGKSFKGPRYAPDSNLKVKLNQTDKVWYYNHPEARNFLGSAMSIEKDGARTRLGKGLYSTDGFASIDDSKTDIIDNNGYVNKNDLNNIDIYLFMYKRDFGLCLKDYFTLTGFPPLVPRYALGIWWNRDLIYSFNDIKKIVEEFDKNEVPLSVLLLSEFWHKKDSNDYNKYKTGFEFNLDLFKEPSLLTKYLHSKHIRLGVNIDPVEGITTRDKAYPIMAHELSVNDNSPIYLDLYNHKYVDSYLKNLITPLYKYVDFFWIDYKNNIDNLRLLNYYQFNDFNKYKEKRPLLLSRNPGIAAHNYPVHYSGETTVSWDTLKYIFNFNLRGANIGLNYWSHDVGGFKGGVENSELYLRYVEASVFMPIFRFSAKRGVYYKREPWLWDIYTSTIAKKYCLLRHKIIPYIYSECYNYHKTGIPLVMPLYYFYPEIYDEPLYKDEYFFGTELLIKPITKKMDNIMNRSVERIFLPSGVWYDYNTGKKFIGGKRYVSFYKLEDYPIFAKPGSIIPFSVLDDINDTSAPKKMEITVFPGKSNTYELYEDDGVTSLYKEGYYLKTNIEYKYQSDNFTLSVSPLEGKSKVIPDYRDYYFRFKNTRVPEKVKVIINNELISSNYEYYNEDNDFIVLIKNVSTRVKTEVILSGRNIEIDETRIINEDINQIINELDIKTELKEKLASIIFSKFDIKVKRIYVRKLKKDGLNDLFIKMFLRLLEYLEEI